MLTTDPDDFPWPPDRDDPRIAVLEAELATERRVSEAQDDLLHRWQMLGSEFKRLVYDMPPDLHFELSELLNDTRASVDEEVAAEPVERDEHREVLDCPGDL
jgi:hypothetical protein